MAETQDLKTIALTAGADLSGKQYYVMRLTDAAETVNIASLKTSSEMIGVLQNAPSASGRRASVAYSGKGKVVLGAAVNSAGVYLSVNGTGRAVIAGSGDMVFGKALQTGGAAGVIISALLFVPFRLSGAV